MYFLLAFSNKEKEVLRGKVSCPKSKALVAKEVAVWIQMWILPTT